MLVQRDGQTKEPWERKKENGCRELPRRPSEGAKKKPDTLSERKKERKREDDSKSEA